MLSVSGTLAALRLRQLVERAITGQAVTTCHQGMVIALERMLGSEASCQPFSTACDATSAQQQQQGTAAAVWAEAAGLPRTLTALPRKDRRQVWMRQQEERAKLAQLPVERAEQPPEQRMVPPDDAGPEQGGKEEELSMWGNMQPYILQHAARACEEPSREKFEGYVQKLVELVKARGHQMKPISVSSALHRLSRTAVTYTNTIGAMAHVDASVAGTPGLDGLLEDLSRMALAQAPALGTWAVPNIMWSLGILHANPLEGELVRALLARTMELCRAGTHLTPMGAAHIFWACAALRVKDEEVFDALGEHMLEAGVSKGLNVIDLSNIFWACGVLGISPAGGRLLPHLATDAVASAADMNQQGVSNVLWGLSKQDVGAAANMYKMPGTPYILLIEAMLRRSSELWAQPDSSGVNYSMTLWALGNLGYHPGEAYLAHHLACLHASGLVASFDAQNMCSLVWGFARLGEHPGPELLQALKDRRHAALFCGEAGENVQAMTNVLWSLCVFDELDPAFAAEVYARMPLITSEVAKAQAFQASLYLEAAMPGHAPSMPPALYRTCREAWLGMKDVVTVSMLQWSVLQSLRTAGFDVQPEYADKFFSVDLAVFLPQRRGPPVKVAVEVDGVEHYSCNRAKVNGVHQYRPLGRTVLRNRLLRAQGWAVCDIPWFEWNALRSQKAREAYLKARFALELQSRRNAGEAGVAA